MATTNDRGLLRTFDERHEAARCPRPRVERAPRRPGGRWPRADAGHGVAPHAARVAPSGAGCCRRRRTRCLKSCVCASCVCASCVCACVRARVRVRCVCAPIVCRPQRYGTELADARQRRDASDSDDGGGGDTPPAGRSLDGPPSAPNSGGSKQRVFRVTTLEDGDYDSIPLQRLKNVVGTDGWAGRLGVWLLVAMVVGSILLTTCYMHAKAHFLRATKVSAEIRAVDTSSNDVVHWLKMERRAPQVRAKHPTMSNPSTRLHTAVTDNPRHPLTLSHRTAASALDDGSGALNVPGTLRLPVGLATTLDIQQLMQSKEFDDDITPGHDSTFHRLKTLREALPIDVYQSTANKRVRLDLMRLLRVARRAKVVTEVPLAIGSGKLAAAWGAGRGGFSELHTNRVRERLVQQLHRFVECTRKGAEVPCSVYADIMRYPGSASLLYWGKFSLLRFEGPGVLYWRNGLVAYNGTWSNGTMHGWGRLSDTLGNHLWTGSFRQGQPQWTLVSLWHNYVTAQ
jgi:hypothetical protein